MNVLVSTKAIGAALAILFLAILYPAATAVASQSEKFAGYIQQQNVEALPFGMWPGSQVRMLSEDPASGRFAGVVELPAGFQVNLTPGSAHSFEWVILEGEVELGEQRLERLDFVYIPPGSPATGIRTRNGARLLLFVDPEPTPVGVEEIRKLLVVDYEPDGWEPARLAREAGATAALEVFHLKRDPVTTARTWYVRLSGDMKVPWEVHSMVEEGYLLEGGYRLAECLPDETLIGDYQAGGYFRRPAGIPHSGPDSGPLEDVIWLQRSPVALDVAFYRDCVAGRPIEPLQISK